MLGHEHSLSDVAAAVCCEVAGFLTSQPGSSGGFFCEKTCVKWISGDGGKPVTIVSGTVKDGLSNHGLQILVPIIYQQSNCCFDPRDCLGMHPTGNDVLFVLLLALPMQTWSGIKDESLAQELASLVSTENLPVLLKDEVSNSLLSLTLYIFSWDQPIDNHWGTSIRLFKFNTGSGSHIQHWYMSSVSLGDALHYFHVSGPKTKCRTTIQVLRISSVLDYVNAYNYSFRLSDRL